MLPFSTPSDATTVTRGLSSLKEFSVKQGDDELTKYLNVKLQENDGNVLLHAKCCREYIDDKRIQRHVTTNTTNGSPKIFSHLLKSNSKSVVLNSLKIDIYTTATAQNPSFEFFFVCYLNKQANSNLNSKIRFIKPYSHFMCADDSMYTFCNC